MAAKESIFEKYFIHAAITLALAAILWTAAFMYQTGITMGVISNQMTEIVAIVKTLPNTYVTIPQLTAVKSEMADHESRIRTLEVRKGK